MTANATTTPAPNATPAAGTPAAALENPTQHDSSQPAPAAPTGPEWFIKETGRLREEKRAAEARATELEAKQRAADEERMTRERNFEALAKQKGEEAAKNAAEVERLKASQDQVYVEAQLAALRRELIDPEDARLFEREGLKVENGQVIGLDAAWAAFKAKKAHLFRADGAPAPAGMPGSPASLHPANAGARPAPKNPADMSRAEWDAHLASEGEKLRTK